MTKIFDTTNPSSTTSRRAFIRSATALAALGSMPAMATAGDDAELIVMGKEFDRLHADSEAYNNEVAHPLWEKAETIIDGIPVAPGDDEITHRLKHIGFAHNESGFIPVNDLMWEKLEAEDRLARRIMDMRARTLRGIAVQARVVAASPWPELEAAMPGGDGMHDYPIELLVKLLRSIEEAANA